MNEYLAHSAHNGGAPQTYEAHVRGVCEKATAYAQQAERYYNGTERILTQIVRQSALLHDLGKLDDRNQGVLQDENTGGRHLPVNHVDAGSAYWISRNNPRAALIVSSHHKGLPDFGDESSRSAPFRDVRPSVREHTDKTLDTLLLRHKEKCLLPLHTKTVPYQGDQNVLYRMALSCLADADHGDTAAAYGQTAAENEVPLLCAEKRLAALDGYVSSLGGDDERSRLRSDMYRACRNAESISGFSLCDSPVGSGKTTAVMAHLLRQATLRNARRIFVVLPYTGIIRQSADVYRKALTLPGEDPEQVVAELHSRADFHDRSTRCLTSLWRAPIIVTTAVAFFETLAACRPAALRRLHELPGSVIFADEAHGALPIRLLPLAWRWMNSLADEWSCYWVLASGSLVHYWELERLKDSHMAQPHVAQLVPDDLRKRLAVYERNRIAFRYRDLPIDRHELVEWVNEMPGPRLLILNTVQNAAVIASELSQKYGRIRVEHLSTALTPEDRGKTIARVNRRLRDAADTDWTLVATSCVEAGVDFSFRTGFRQIASLLSLLQAAGRVNRHGEYTDADMWSFSLREDSMLTENTSLNSSAEILKGYFRSEIPIVPDLSTRSMNDEIVRDDSCLRKIRFFLKQEGAMQFQTIDREFNVIDSDTVLAVVDPSLAERIQQGKCDWQTLQKQSVSIRRTKASRLCLKEIAGDVYRWTSGYDDFIGYMRGIIRDGEA